MKEARDAFRRFWPLTRGDRKWLAVIIACVVVSALSETAAILLFADLTDNALKAGSLSDFWGPAAAWLAVAALGALVGYFGNSLATWTAERFVLRLRANVFRHVQDLPPHFFQKHRQGDLVERLTGDVEAIEQMVVSGAVGTISAAFSAVFYACAALYLRWDLALATFVLAPLFLLAARRFSGRIKQASQDERVADGAITSVVEESLGNVVLTQAYNRRRDEEKRLDVEARAWMKASVRGARLSEMYEQFVEVVETLCVLAVIGLGVWEISADRMTLGALLAFAAFIGYLYPRSATSANSASPSPPPRPAPPASTRSWTPPRPWATPRTRPRLARPRLGQLPRRDLRLPRRDPALGRRRHLQGGPGRAGDHHR